MSSQRPELVNFAARTFHLEVGWLGDHPTSPSASSVDADAFTLTECLELRLEYHPASTYIVEVQAYPEWVLARVALALRRSTTAIAEPTSEPACLSVRLRALHETCPEPTFVEPPPQDGLALLLAESVQTVLANLVSTARKHKSHAPSQREVQGVLFS